jgi:hypothetical protein
VLVSPSLLFQVYGHPHLSPFIPTTLLSGFLTKTPPSDESIVPLDHGDMIPIILALVFLDNHRLATNSHTPNPSHAHSTTTTATTFSLIDHGASSHSSIDFLFSTFYASQTGLWFFSTFTR